MAVAAAGGGLLIAAAGAVPAYAAAPAAHPGGHKITITAHPRAHAATGIGPHDILPCAVKPGAAMKPASCGDETISCVISAGTPFFVNAAGSVDGLADVRCSSSVPEILLHETLLRSGVAVSTDDDPAIDRAGAATVVAESCRAGTYTNTASATISFPPGYVITAGTNPIHQTSASLTTTTSSCHPLGSGGGGGGGGCAIRAPSLAGHLAGRHPDFISCG
jgi:hypothetical protein